MGKVTINIDVQFGSDLQKEVTMDSLTACMEAIKIHMISHHKRNKFEYEILKDGDTHDKA